jgi:hypothetical protein
MPKRLTDAETVPVMRTAGLEPLEPYPGRDAHWRCRCNTCGREVNPRFVSIRKGQGGCQKMSFRYQPPGTGGHLKWRPCRTQRPDT